jgi:serine/threonine-protein kinase
MLKSLFRSTLIVGILAGIAGVGAYWGISYLIRHEDPVMVPDLAGKEIVPVLEILSQLDLNPKLEKTEYSRTHSKNRVITQSPPAGTQIKKGRDVRLTLSKGPRTQSIPDLTGLSHGEARSLMIAQDLCQGVVSHTRNPDRGGNEVLAQAPLPGISVTGEACVDLLVNRGDEGELYKMPDFTKDILAKGLARIAESGFIKGEISHARDPHQRPNIILKQIPRQGTPVGLGHSVNLVVNSLDHGTKGAAFQTSLIDPLIKHRVEWGFLQQRVRINWRSGSLNADLYDDFVPPGEEVWVLIPRYQDATVEVFQSETRIKTKQYHVRGHK